MCGAASAEKSILLFASLAALVSVRTLFSVRLGGGGGGSYELVARPVVDGVDGRVRAGGEGEGTCAVPRPDVNGVAGRRQLTDKTDYRVRVGVRVRVRVT